MEFLCNNQLQPHEKQHMLQRFPTHIKLSYETVAHKKVSAEYNIGVAIPYGRKAYLWWTYYKNQIVCCLLELNRTNVVGENVSFVNVPCPTDFELGTIVSGVLIDENVDANQRQHFLVDDVYMYKGTVINAFQPVPFSRKTGYISDMFMRIRLLESSSDSLLLHYYVFWTRDIAQNDDTIPEKVHVPYNIRHIQYRNTNEVCPHLNVSFHKKPVWNPSLVSDSVERSSSGQTSVWDNVEKPVVPNWTLDFYKGLYNQSCLFWVKADLSFDVYYLYAADEKTGQPTLYQYACVNNYKTSVMMNKIFRNIKENDNIDYVEESDDEDEYEDIRRDKFVDLQKQVLMECVFDRKFKKWIPVREEPRDLGKYVPLLHQLVVMKPSHGSKPHEGHRHNNNNNNNKHRNRDRDPNRNRDRDPNRRKHDQRPQQNKMVR